MVPGKSGGFDRHRLYRLDQLPARPKREEIVAGIIARGELIALTGAPGAGKTAVAVLLAGCIARGDQFLGRASAEGDVLYIAGEKAAGTLRRLQAIESAETRIFVRSSPILLDGDDPQFIRNVKESGCEPTLIIVDTLARALGQLDENSNRDAGIALNRLAAIGEAFPNAATVLIHHTAKGSKAMRGASAILAAVDVEVRVDGAGTRRSLRVVKANDIADGWSLNFEMVVVDVDSQATITARAIDAAQQPAGGLKPLTPKALQLMKMLPAGESSRAEVLAISRRDSLLGANTETQGERLRQLLTELKRHGLIEYDNKTVHRIAPSEPKLPPSCPQAAGGTPPSGKTQVAPPPLGGRLGVAGVCKDDRAA